MDDDYQKLDFKKYEDMIKDTIKSIETTQLECKQAREQVKKTFEGANQTIKDYKTLQSDYDNLFSNIVDSIIKKGNENCLNQTKQLGNSNIVKNIDKDIQIDLKKIKKTIILTGAGISVASGIPPYRGTLASDGYTSKDDSFYSNEEIATIEFMNKNSKVFWEEYEDFYKFISDKKPNKNHEIIQKALQNDKENKITLITQNIDDLHCQFYEQNQNKMNPSDKIFQFHGNYFYGRCGEETPCNQDNKIFRFDKEQQFPPNCKFCGGKARPNVLYFDESYDEENYFVETLEKQINIKDFHSIHEQQMILLVLGTTLETNKALSIVSQFVQKNQIVIEVNPETNVVKAGRHSYFIQEKCEDIIEQLFNKLQII